MYIDSIGTLYNSHVINVYIINIEVLLLRGIINDPAILKL